MRFETRSIETACKFLNTMDKSRGSQSVNSNGLPVYNSENNETLQKWAVPAAHNTEQ